MPRPQYNGNAQPTGKRIYGFPRARNFALAARCNPTANAIQ